VEVNIPVGVLVGAGLGDGVEVGVGAKLEVGVGFRGEAGPHALKIKAAVVTRFTRRYCGRCRRRGDWPGVFVVGEGRLQLVMKIRSMVNEKIFFMEGVPFCPVSSFPS
jgi:hypothetical protein